ncbi:adenine permease [Acinetobacter gyllenbergii]|uniref:MFS transporter, AGZA family, xanthine/uracil permease n=2 Tax=Acinetobacter gyllenbergii TaxID=134534 RepID=A0A829HI81_9GAMM|nr:NCS2 family permease [Acinetobacter gyllenbergii]EPF87775.1 MFS transporter, AGZA family, xanthine/uracil permease [Acinetobacter gyllenbergii CIP 110306 = MTCC 11365]EPH34485.1 Xanthine/uracil/thiamine/ascorbate permease family protein [Acinetobacter gyllenbergii CIP 110306 = MTCC 11365]OBY75772.1 guanine permease [Acinetobacter gyllenbergii]GMA11722.1 adenine permease [Acinetobacter gyllenbergii]
MTTPNASAGLLERLFKLSDNKTNFRTEVLAGVTTFLTMCYIIIVNPLILSETGMDHGAVFVATCLAAAIGCLVMGIIANYPIALAPGMGLNAYFTYSVCLGMGVPWQTALAAVFVSGLVFLAISFFKIREAIVNAIPMSLKFAIGGGIGLFLALIALKNAGIIVDNPATLVGLGDIKQPTVLLALFGFLMIVVLHQFKVRGAIILSILVVTAIATAMGLNEFKGVVGQVPSLAPTFMQMDFKGLFTASMVGVIFVFFIVDLFDSTGTLVGVSHRAGLLQDGKLPRLKKALFADSTAIVAGAALGTSSTTPYIESASGVAAGGRTGLTAVVVAFLFIGCLFLAPLAQSVPGFATAPALLFIGVLMIQGITHIDWDDITEAVPAFLTIVFMPFTYSIADGIAMGFISYALVKLLTGKAKTVPYMVWIIAALWVFKFVAFGG